MMSQKETVTAIVTLRISRRAQPARTRSTPLKAKGYHTRTFRALFGTFYATLDAVPPVPDEERYPVWLIPRDYHTIMADASSRIPCRTDGRCWSGAQTPTTTS